MRNYLQSGEHIVLPAPADVSSGELVIVGNLAGVAAAAAENGALVTLAMEGVYTLPKLTTAVLAAGGAVSWDATAGHCVVPGTGKYPIGLAVEAAGNSATTARVRLNGTATAAAS